MVRLLAEKMMFIVYLQVKVENFSTETHTITNVTLKNSVSSKVMTLRDTVLFPYSLESGHFLELEVIAVAKFVVF